jgi:hypothetical protein
MDHEGLDEGADREFTIQQSDDTPIGMRAVLYYDSNAMKESIPFTIATNLVVLLGEQ